MRFRSSSVPLARLRRRTMSGWDEGNVYFTDSGLAGDGDAPGGGGGGDALGVTPGQARRKFADFFRNFRGEPTADYPDGRLTYRDALDQAMPPQELTVLMDDVIGARDAFRFRRGESVSRVS
jgi:DNA replication licensing factor MCM5